MSFDCQLINSSWCKVVRNLILINNDEGFVKSHSCLVKIMTLCVMKRGCKPYPHLDCTSRQKMWST